MNLDRETIFLALLGYPFPRGPPRLNPPPPTSGIISPALHIATGFFHDDHLRCKSRHSETHPIHNCEQVRLQVLFRVKLHDIPISDDQRFDVPLSADRAATAA